MTLKEIRDTIDKASAELWDMRQSAGRKAREIYSTYKDGPICDAEYTYYCRERDILDEITSHLENAIEILDEEYDL